MIFKRVFPGTGILFRIYLVKCDLCDVPDCKTSARSFVLFFFRRGQFAMAPRSSIYEFFNVRVTRQLSSTRPDVVFPLSPAPPANLLKAATATLYPKCKAVNFDVSLVWATDFFLVLYARCHAGNERRFFTAAFKRLSPLISLVRSIVTFLKIEIITDSWRFASEDCDDL